MISDIKDIANILFFVIIGSVTIMSYLQARKTLFAPIRTEVFKLQLKIFEEVLTFFQNKTEINFIEICDFNRICRLNAFKMVDEYAETFFASELQKNKDIQKEKYSVLTRAIILAEHVGKNVRPLFESPNTPEPHTPPPITNPALLLSKWQKYEHPAIHFTNELAEIQAELKRLSISPILPSNIRKLIIEFNDTVTSNLILVGTTVTEFSQQMPELAPRASDLYKFNATWVTNSYHNKRKPLEPKAEQILIAINEYLKVEQLMH